jgi:hypothetical protein
MCFTSLLRYESQSGRTVDDFFRDSLGGALKVIDAKGRPLVVPKIELGEIALEMLLADVVLHARNAALQDREISLNRAGALHAVLVLFVTDIGLVGLYRLAGATERTVLVGKQFAFCAP